MSQPPSNTHTLPAGSGRLSRDAYESLKRRCRAGAVVAALQTVAFWTAVVLPFLHLSLLLSGLESPAELGVYLTLLAANVGTLIVGHPHGN